MNIRMSVSTRRVVADISVEKRRAVIELIASLAYAKSEMVNRILRPAGVRPDVYRPLLTRKDELTGRLISKRQIASLLMDALGRDPEGDAVVREMLEIGAAWTGSHLAHDEYEARPAVQKARELLGTLNAEAEHEEAHRAAAHADMLHRAEEQHATIIRQQSELLLQMFDQLSTSNDKQERGYLLQELLNPLFDAYGLPVFRAFKRNEGAEQIDGAFKLDG
jgi:hypothetical protein